MSKVAAAITSPATKAAKQENSTKSLRSIRIRAPSPLLRGLRLASKRLIVAKDRARRHRVQYWATTGTIFPTLSAIAPGSPYDITLVIQAPLHVIGLDERLM
jgi:hypothetical protein